MLSRSSINFGLKEHPISEFELVAEELLMSDSNIQVSRLRFSFILANSIQIMLVA